MTPLENDSYCAMVNLIVDFNKSGHQETYESFVKSKQAELSYEMDKIRGEYIFLIDRNWSMRGEKIEMAKSSLQLFLKSLPKDSYYNVVSFGHNYGSYYDFLHPFSEKSSQRNLANTIQLVEKFEAEMGISDAYPALNRIYNRGFIAGYPRYVFLLTDGGVNNTANVLRLIQEHSSKIRTFTIGIGNECSIESIKEAAFYGKGKYDFIVDSKDTHAKVINMLDASLSPTYSDFSLQANNFDEVVEAVTPIPSSISFLTSGEQITFFLFIRKEAFTQDKKMVLELRFYDSRIEDYRSVKIILDSEKVIKNNMIPKLAIHDMIKRLEQQQKLYSRKKEWGWLHDEELTNAFTNMFDEPETELPIVSEEQKMEEPRLWSDKGDISKALLELSVKYGVLCKETALYCEIAQNTYEVKLLQPGKKVVPKLPAQDCASSSEEENDEDNRPGMGYLFGDDDKVPSPPYKPVSFDPYIEIVMKQTFEGYWDPTDKSIQSSVLAGDKLVQVPQELNIPDNQAESEKVWITILVLLWLEVVFQKEKQAWRLIHQKGCDWLKSRGISYEKVKDFGKSAIKVTFSLDIGITS